MKDNLLDTLKDLLLDSLENSLSKDIKTDKSEENDEKALPETQFEYVSAPKAKSFRILDDEECVKLNVYCQNFLLRVERLGLLIPKGREAIIDQLVQYEADSIGFDEVKWTFINSLNTTLTEKELLFLDFILDENTYIVH